MWVENVGKKLKDKVSAGGISYELDITGMNTGFQEEVQSKNGLGQRCGEFGVRDKC